MPNMKTVTVGSHLDKISFGGTEIPLGFLTSFRKKNHHICQSGRGFIIKREKPDSKPINVVCDCVIPRAAKKLKLVGKEGFEQLSRTWLDEEKARIAEDEARCRKEGYDAPLHVPCPYPEKTDQALAWEEGRKKKFSEGSGGEQSATSTVAEAHEEGGKPAA